MYTLHATLWRVWMNKSSCGFHNLCGYDSHILMLAIFSVEDRASCTLKNMDKCVGLANALLCGNHYVSSFEPRLVPLSKVLYHLLLLWTEM